MARKILVSMDEHLIARIDAAAREAGLTRSAYLSRLATSAMGEPRGPGASPGARRSLAALDRLFAKAGMPSDATAAVRAARDQR